MSAAETTEPMTTAKPKKTIEKKSGAKKGDRAVAALRKRIDKAQSTLEALQSKLGQLTGAAEQPKTSECPAT